MCEILLEVTQIANNLKNFGLNVEIGNKFIKIRCKNEEDIQKLMEIIERMS